MEAASLGGPGLRTPTESRFPSLVGHSTSLGQSGFGGVEKQIPPLDGRCSEVTVQREARAERGGSVVILFCSQPHCVSLGSWERS